MMFKCRQYIPHMTGDGWIFRCRKKCVAYRIDDGAVIARLVRKIRLVEVRALPGLEVVMTAKCWAMLAAEPDVSTG